ATPVRGFHAKSYQQSSKRTGRLSVREKAAARASACTSQKASLRGMEAESGSTAKPAQVRRFSSPFRAREVNRARMPARGTATAKRRSTRRSVTDDATDSRAFNACSNIGWTTVPRAHVRKSRIGWDLDRLGGICAG